MSSSSTVRTTRRRTLRLAAAALTAAAGLTLTACSGSDAADAKPSAQTDTKAGAEAGGASSSPGAQGSDAPASPGAKAGAKSDAAGKQSGGQQSGGAPAGNGGKAASPVRTQRLADGISKAEIYKVGTQQYRAKIVANGSTLATLEAKGHDAGLDANDMFVVLTLDGKVHSWMGGGHQGPGTFKIAGGWTVKVSKVGELRYRAQFISPSGDADDTVEANQHDIGFVTNGVYVVLSAGGMISAHA
ncbi:hypothetical protein [Streptomyces tubercidicus]|uniref:hypothetical protein n=1 Tax=Streptomyces tubercidicus TaxID=47759 RepID=UPI0034677DC6